MAAAAAAATADLLGLGEILCCLLAATSQSASGDGARMAWQQLAAPQAQALPPVLFPAPLQFQFSLGHLEQQAQPPGAVPRGVVEVASPLAAAAGSPWQARVSRSTGRTYFRHAGTGEKTWDAGVARGGGAPAGGG